MRLSTFLIFGFFIGCSQSTPEPTHSRPTAWPADAEAAVSQTDDNTFLTWPEPQVAVDKYRVEHVISEVQHGGGWVFEKSSFDVHYSHITTVTERRYKTPSNPAGLTGHQFFVQFTIVAIAGDSEVGRLTATDHLFVSR